MESEIRPGIKGFNSVALPSNGNNLLESELVTRAGSKAKDENANLGTVMETNRKNIRRQSILGQEGKSPTNFVNIENGDGGVV